MASQQLAAAFAYSVAEYTYTLNVSTRSGVLKMRYANLIALIALILIRGFWFLLIVYKHLEMFYNDGKMYAFYISIGVAIVFMVFNVQVVIIPFYKRTVKWFGKKLPEEKKVEVEDTKKDN